jgi:non-ribosomal peptide synthetase component E (peptide arylation enzyme)
MFYFTDRMKNIIRRSGENIAAAEMEACLVAHEKVQQAAVIAVPDELREEEVTACIVPQTPTDAGEALARELTEWCRARLAYFKSPAWYLFTNELPTGSSQTQVGQSSPPPDELRESCQQVSAAVRKFSLYCGATDSAEIRQKRLRRGEC